MAALAAEILASAGPSSRSGSIAALRRYVEATRGKVEVEVEALRSLIRLDSNGNDTAELVSQYYTEHKDAHTRSAIITPIGLVHTSNRILIGLVIDSLGSKDPDVQLAAIDTAFNAGELMMSAARATS